MDIVTRSEWGARTPRDGGFPTTPLSTRTGFVVHYSAANANQTVRSIQNYQMDTRGWRDIGYNFLVDHNGVAYEGCQGTWRAIGAHVAGHNTANIGVCAIGTNDDINEVQMRKIRALYDEACRVTKRTLAMKYHSGMSGANTSCPGDKLRAWVLRGMPMSTQEDEDMTPEQAKQLKDTHFTTAVGINDPDDPTKAVPLHVWAEKTTRDIKGLAEKLDQLLSRTE